MKLKPHENKKKIERIIKNQIDKYQRSVGGVLVVFDFDELLVEGHLSRTVSEAFGKTEERLRIIKEHGDNTFEGMKELNLILKGYGYGALEIKKRPIVNGMAWREGAEDLLRKLDDSPGYEVLVLSCGRYMPQYMKLAGLGLSDVLVACEMEFVDGKAEKNKHIVSDDMKGYIVRRLRNSKVFQEVYVVGHGDGDVDMLKEGVGIALNPSEKAREAAKHEIKKLDEIYSIIGLEKGGCLFLH